MNCDDRVDQILEYWLKGDLRNKYHCKWFPSATSTQVQKLADEEIYSLFNAHLSAALNGELNHWISWMDDPVVALNQLNVFDNLNSCIAIIIILDQFSRHIFRYLALEPAAAERKRADELAFNASKKFHKQVMTYKSYHDAIVNLPLQHFIFSLMPFRHNPTIENLTFVLDRLKLKEEHDSSQSSFNQELLLKFQKQTIRRLQHLQDRATVLRLFKRSCPSHASLSFHLHLQLEATDDILERFPFAADESDILAHPLVRATDAFLRRHFAALAPQDRRGGDPLEAAVFLSLSGGVDSMVLAKILAVLRAAYAAETRPALRILTLTVRRIGPLSSLAALTGGSCRPSTSTTRTDPSRGERPPS
jgi:uncharacterized protein (DUF924 family)